jgi:hypothetical protein
MCYLAAQDTDFVFLPHILAEKQIPGTLYSSSPTAQLSKEKNEV